RQEPMTWRLYKSIYEAATNSHSEVENRAARNGVRNVDSTTRYDAISGSQGAQTHFDPRTDQLARDVLDDAFGVRFGDRLVESAGRRGSVVFDAADPERPGHSRIRTNYKADDLP